MSGPDIIIQSRTGCSQDTPAKSSSTTSVSELNVYLFPEIPTWGTLLSLLGLAPGSHNYHRLAHIHNCHTRKDGHPASSQTRPNRPRPPRRDPRTNPRLPAASHRARRRLRHEARVRQVGGGEPAAVREILCRPGGLYEEQRRRGGPHLYSDCHARTADLLGPRPWFGECCSDRSLRSFGD